MTMSQMSPSPADERKNRLEEVGLSDPEARSGQDQEPSLYSHFPSLNKPADADFSRVIADYQEALETLQDQLNSQAS